MADIASNNEANLGLVNIGDVSPTLNVEAHWHGVQKPSIFERIGHALDPVGYERRRGEAALTALDYEIAMTKRVREEFPFMSPERALLYAHGFNRTEAQAENFNAVVEKVEELLEAPPKELPEPAIEDAFTDSMCDAYDEEVRCLLARALKGEFDAKGSISRNTLSIVKCMDSDDVGKFAYFCSLCSGGVDATTGITFPTVPCIVQRFDKTGSSRYLELEHGDAMHLDSLRLVSTSSGMTFETGEAALCIDGRGYHTERIGAGGASFRISSIAFTQAGQELSSFFEKGTHPKLLEIVQDGLKSQGFELVAGLQLEIVGNLTTGEFADDQGS